MVLAFAYVAIGDSRYLTVGRDYLVTFASWPFWVADSKLGDRDLTLGFMFRACAIAYDWIYDSLSASGRMAMNDAIVKHAQAMYKAASGPYNAGWANWWPQSYGRTTGTTTTRLSAWPRLYLTESATAAYGSTMRYARCAGTAATLRTSETAGFQWKPETGQKPSQ